MQKSIIIVMLVFMVWGCDQAGKTGSTKPLSATDRAAMLYSEGKPEEALAALQQAITQNPQDASAYRLLGDLYLAANQLDLAETAYRQALQIQPDSGIVYNSLGILYTKKGDMQLAVNNFNLAVHKDPTLVPAYSNLGDMALAGEQPELAVGFYQKALTIDPTYEPAKIKLNQIGQVLQAAAAAQQETGKTTEGTPQL